MFRRDCSQGARGFPERFLAGRSEDAANLYQLVLRLNTLTAGDSIPSGVASYPVRREGEAKRPEPNEKEFHRVMTTSKCLITFSGMIALLIPLSVQAATKNHTPLTLGQEARDRLQTIQYEANAAVTQTEQLQQYVKNPIITPDAELSPLFSLKDDVNTIGKLAGTLEAERAALDPWEQKAIDKVFPLAEKAVRDTQNAIACYNQGKSHLWTTQFEAYNDKLDNDSQEIAKTLESYIKYDKAHEEEQQLEPVVGAGGN
jgi:hypothetical protein